MCISLRILKTTFITLSLFSQTINWRNVVNDGHARPMRYEIKAFRAFLNEILLYKTVFYKLSDEDIKSILHPLRHPKFFGDKKLFPKNMTDNTKKLFINELMNESPESKSSGLKYMYREADPNATVYTFTNLLNFNLYYVTIRA